MPAATFTAEQQAILVNFVKFGVDDLIRRQAIRRDASCTVMYLGTAGENTIQLCTTIEIADLHLLAQRSGHVRLGVVGNLLRADAEFQALAAALDPSSQHIIHVRHQDGRQFSTRIEVNPAQSLRAQLSSAELEQAMALGSADWLWA